MQLQAFKKSYPTAIFAESLARIIHKCCLALACPFVRNKSLVGRPYAWLRTPSSESVANKGSAHKKAGCCLDELWLARRVSPMDGANQSSRRFINNAGLRFTLIPDHP